MDADGEAKLFDDSDSFDSPASLVARNRMIDAQLRRREIHDQRVLEAFASVPRELFVPGDLFGRAYEDCPLPIGYEQTISQPYVVALMLQLLESRPEDRVLDVGSGSGYQSALLGKMVKSVYGIERIDALATSARQALAKLSIENVTIRTGDGSLGWPDEAPFDYIICGAGAPEIPQSWIDQLVDGGRIVMPVGQAASQVLIVAQKHRSELVRHEICAVRFVKLLGEQGWAT